MFKVIRSLEAGTVVPAYRVKNTTFETQIEAENYARNSVMSGETPMLVVQVLQRVSKGQSPVIVEEVR